MSDSGRDFGANTDKEIQRRNAYKRGGTRDLGSLFFALYELSKAKTKSKIISDCLWVAIEAALDKNECEVAAMLGSLRRQLVEVPETTPIQESESVQALPFQPIQRGVYQLPDGSMVAVD